MADLSTNLLDLADQIKTILTNDNLVSAAVSSTISPAGRALRADVVTKFAAWEQDKENETAQAVNAAAAGLGNPGA